MQRKKFVVMGQSMWSSGVIVKHRVIGNHVQKLKNSTYRLLKVEDDTLLSIC